jgi:hypothetical protein
MHTHDQSDMALVVGGVEGKSHDGGFSEPRNLIDHEDQDPQAHDRPRSQYGSQSGLV